MAAVVVGLLVAAVAGAATGLLRVGAKLPTHSLSGPGEPQYRGERTVVASGTTPSAGRWTMTIVQSNTGFCLGLDLLDSPLGEDMSEGCGGPADFTAANVGGGDQLPDTSLVFGPVPAQAAVVRVTAPGGFNRTARIYDGPREVPGNFYLVEIPRKLRGVIVTWLDKAGHPRGPGVEVPGTIDYGHGSKAPEPPH